MFAFRSCLCALSPSDVLGAFPRTWAPSFPEDLSISGCHVFLCLFCWGRGKSHVLDTRDSPDAQIVHGEGTL